MAEKEVITIPQPPSGLPKDVEFKWKQAYVLAFKDSQASDPENPGAWSQPATREANKVLRVPEPQSFGDAMNLADWMVMHREQKKTKDGVVLNVVTRHGKKFSFPVPAKFVVEPKTPASAKQNGAGTGTDSTQTNGGAGAGDGADKEKK